VLRINQHFIKCKGLLPRSKRSRKAEKFSALVRLFFPSGKVGCISEVQPCMVMKLNVMLHTVRFAGI
jgi:hypothetical protein